MKRRDATTCALKHRPHNFASLNGRIVDSSLLTIPAQSSAAIYGKGIFTTLAIHNGVPFLWSKHRKRIETDSAKLGIDLDEFPEAKTRNALADLIAANANKDCRARITFFDDSPTALWPYEAACRTSMLITTADFRSVARNFALSISPHLVNSSSPLSGVKSNNYLEKILAKDEAKRRGFDEAVQLNERGEVTSACTANIFWLKDGKMFTPSLETGCLPGTTREFVLENIDCEEVATGIDTLRTADQIFLTSAGIGNVQVAEFEGSQLERQHHPIMKLVP